MQHSKIITTFDNIEKFRMEYPEFQKYSTSTIKKLSYEMFDEIGNILTSQPNGILIDGLGYFAATQYNEETTFITKYGKLVVEDIPPYQIKFFPDVLKYKNFYNWEYKASTGVRKKLYDRVKQDDMRYSNHYEMLKMLKKHGKKYFIK